jgi:hypothetical protein
MRSQSSMIITPSLRASRIPSVWLSHFGSSTSRSTISIWISFYSPGFGDGVVTLYAQNRHGRITNNLIREIVLVPSSNDEHVGARTPYCFDQSLFD